MSVELQDIVVDFPGVRALDHVSVAFDFRQIHSIVGENGAGKSTFVNVLGGTIAPTSGTIRINGVQTNLHSPRDALAQGISLVSQEGSLVPELSGAANILLGDEPQAYGVISEKALKRRAEELMNKWFSGLDIDLVRPVRELAVADQKVIEIVRALRRDIRLVILDEPTATLQSREKKQLWSIIRKLPEIGVGVVLISHFLSEVAALSDIITVLRDGRHVQTMPRKDASESLLVDLMLRRQNGATASQPAKQAQRKFGPPVISVKEWQTEEVRLPDFNVKAGEIVGLIGLTGSGHFEFARSLYDSQDATGEAMLQGKPLAHGNMRSMQRAGVALIPDRRLVNALSADGLLSENLAMVHPSFASFQGTGILRPRVERCEARRIVDLLNIKTSSTAEVIRNLSGGNKQKVSIGKWLYGSGERYHLMIFIEPTEGVDIGAKQEIYKQIRELAAAGKGIIIASSDLLEIEEIADRAIAFVRGQAGEDIHRDAFSEARFIAAMTGEK